MIILAGTKEEHLNMLEGGIIAKLLEEKWSTFAQVCYKFASSSSNNPPLALSLPTSVACFKKRKAKLQPHFCKDRDCS